MFGIFIAFYRPGFNLVPWKKPWKTLDIGLSSLCHFYYCGSPYSWLRISMWPCAFPFLTLVLCCDAEQMSLWHLYWFLLTGTDWWLTCCKPLWMNYDAEFETETSLGFTGITGSWGIWLQWIDPVHYFYYIFWLPRLTFLFFPVLIYVTLTQHAFSLYFYCCKFEEISLQ